MALYSLFHSINLIFNLQYVDKKTWIHLVHLFILISGKCDPVNLSFTSLCHTGRMQTINARQKP